MSINTKRARELVKLAESLNLSPVDRITGGNHYAIELKHPETGETTTMFCASTPKCPFAQSKCLKFMQRFLKKGTR